MPLFAPARAEDSTYGGCTYFLREKNINEIIRVSESLVLLPTSTLTVLSSISDRKELLTAINDFLDSSVVLPPGDWDSKNLLSMSEINELRNR